MGVLNNQMVCFSCLNPAKKGLSNTVRWGALSVGLTAPRFGQALLYPLVSMDFIISLKFTDRRNESAEFLYLVKIIDFATLCGCFLSCGFWNMCYWNLGFSCDFDGFVHFFYFCMQYESFLFFLAFLWFFIYFVQIYGNSVIFSKFNEKS